MRAGPSESVRWCALFAAMAFLVGCSGHEEAQEDAVSEAEVAELEEVAEEADEAGLIPFMADRHRVGALRTAFTHDPHGQIDCSTCHENPRGHVSHGEVACADCHGGATQTTTESLTEADCQSCHHGPDQPNDCAVCHGVPGIVETTQPWTLAVWGEARGRALSFQHEIHAAAECAACHAERPAFVPVESCTSCHADHHAEGVTCSACHGDMGEGDHELRVHQTCSGSGCHTAPDVESLAETRTGCLGCHQAQTEHEPRQDCVECHRMRGGDLQ